MRRPGRLRNCELTNSVKPMTPTWRVPSHSRATWSTKSPSWLTRTTSASRSTSASAVRWMAMSTTLPSPLSGIGLKPIASSACTKLIGSSVLAARKNRPVTSWSKARSAHSSSRSQRGRSSGRGRRPRIEVPRVASMFSPSTRR